MPEEILAIVIISIFAGTAMSMVRMILGYRERRFREQAPSGSTLTTSELERMMRRAVESATEPLERKLRALESELSVRRIPDSQGSVQQEFVQGEPARPDSARSEPLIELPDEEEYELAKSVKRREHS